MLQQVVEASPRIAADRAEAEATYAMTTAVVEQLGPIGVFRMLASDRAIELEEYCRVIEQLAFADPSVAWATVNSNGAAMMSAIVDSDIADELLGSANWFFGVGLPPTGKGQRTAEGIKISGRWPVVSGCEYASYFAMNCIIHENGGPVMNGPIPETGFAIVPGAAGRIERTWEGVNAVKGSGSHAVVIDDVLVDERRLVSLDQLQTIDWPYANLPPFALQSLSLGALAIGIGRAAVAGAVAQTANRVSAANGSAWVDYPSVQNSVASADIDVESARHGLFALADQCWRELAADALTPTTNARLHAIADHGFRVARRAVSDLFATGSVDALHSGHILEQSLRDIHGFSVQWERYRRLHYEAGRVLMGAESADPLF